MEQPDGYKMVGEKCAPFNHDISIADANQLREAVVWDFFDTLPVKTPTLTESSDKSMCAKAFHPQYIDDETPSLFVGSMLKHLDEHAWRMNIMWSKLSRARWNNAQQRIETRLIVEVYDEQVIEAVRKMRIARGVGELTVAAIEHQLEEDTESGHVVMRRRAFERPMTPEDCQTGQTMLNHAVKRTLGTHT